MKHKPKHKTDQRADALKANMARRKAQTRDRAEGEKAPQTAQNGPDDQNPVDDA